MIATVTRLGPQNCQTTAQAAEPSPDHGVAYLTASGRIRGDSMTDERMPPAAGRIATTVFDYSVGFLIASYLAGSRGLLWLAQRSHDWQLELAERRADRHERRIDAWMSLGCLEDDE